MTVAGGKSIINRGVLILSLVVSLVIFTLIFLKEEYEWSPNLLDLIELKALDIKFLDRGVMPANKEVVIATIDEKSIEQFGRWPWNRIIIAQLIQKLTQDGARVIAFDVGFSDADQTNIPGVLSAVAEEVDAIEVAKCQDCERMRDAVLKFLKMEIESSNPDTVLAKTIEQAGNVVLGMFMFTNKSEVSQLDKRRLEQSLEEVALSKISLIKPWDANEEKSYRLRLLPAYGVRSPLPIFAEVAEGLGHFSVNLDRDGMLRWADLLWSIPTDDPAYPMIFPSLSLVAAANYLEKEIVVHTYPMGVDRITLGLGDDARTITTDYMGRLLINYHGPQNTFPTFSISDIVNGTTTPGTFKDKIVLVGATATALYDLRSTPFQENMAGVEVHANVIDNILHDDHISRPDWAFYFELFMILFLGLLFGIVLGRIPALWGALFIVLVLVGYFLADKYFFFANGYWVRTVLPMTEAFLLFMVCYVYRYMTEEREKKRTRAAFKQYVNESVINHVMDDYDRLTLGGVKREITVLFSDIRGFTSLSETLSPEELGNILTEYLNPMTEIVLRDQGVLDKYMGDGIMAFWGAPMQINSHPRLACVAALEMIRQLNNLNDVWNARGIPKLRIGIGINTGPMWVGNMGSSLRFDYTVIGDAVNLASRLESTNKQYGTSMIISESTYQAVGNEFLCRELDQIRVKGKLQPVTIYELVADGEGNAKQRDLVMRFPSALEKYREQQWSEALAVFEEILVDFPDDEPCKVFIRRCKEYINTPPPPDWDGVYTMTTK